MTKNQDMDVHKNEKDTQDLEMRMNEKRDTGPEDDTGGARH